MTQPANVDVTVVQVLAVVWSLLQIIVIALVSWLIKSTRASERTLDRLDVTLFGEKGMSGIVAEVKLFGAREESLRRLMQRVVYRLGAIEDELKIPRNRNVDDTDLGDPLT